MTDEGAFDPLRDELTELVGSARALAEWALESGAEGAVCDGDPRALLELLAAPKPAATEGAAKARPAFKPIVPPERRTAERASADSPGAQPAPARAPAPPAPAPARVPARPAIASADRGPKLAVIQEQVRACTLCGLSSSRTQTVFSRGSPDAELVFVGEGPGADEDAQGEPFVGKAGQLLDKMIAAMGLGRDEVYVCNVVKCRPPQNRTPEPAEMAACLPYLNGQLDVIQPKVMVALGSTALRGLLGAGEGITRARGTFRLYRGEIPVMPTFHPAYVLRQPTKEVRGMVWSDLQQVLKLLGRTLPARGG